MLRMSNLLASGSSGDEDTDEGVVLGPRCVIADLAPCTAGWGVNWRHPGWEAHCRRCWSGLDGLAFFLLPSTMVHGPPSDGVELTEESIRG